MDSTFRRLFGHRKFVSPRWGLAHTLKPIPGALPEADMWLPHIGAESQLRRPDAIAFRVWMCDWISLGHTFALSLWIHHSRRGENVVRFAIPAQRASHMPAQGNALGSRSPTIIEP